MYIINNCCFGIDVNRKITEIKDFPLYILDEVIENLELVTNVQKDDGSFFTMEIRSWYHGSSGPDYFPGMIGFHISEELQDFINHITSYDSTFYKNLWNSNITEFLHLINEATKVNNTNIADEEYFSDCQLIINMISTELPEFYSSEGSS